MIIDTNKLREKSSKWYAKKAEQIDKNIKNDERAIRLLTKLENDENMLIKGIEFIENEFKHFVI